MGGSKTAIFTQVVHFYSDEVGQITVGGNRFEPPTTWFEGVKVEL